MIRGQTKAPGAWQGATGAKKAGKARFYHPKPGTCMVCGIRTNQSLCQTCTGWAALGAALQAARKLQGVRR
jgi:hypothetical protein